jgi:23S rRNA (uracil1939-C5)-methyltransferase
MILYRCQDIALYIADQCRKVIGIESVPQSIEDAKMNAAINHIQNVSFHVADIAKIFNQQFYSEHGTPDIVITDPPRTGMHPDVIKELLQMQRRKSLRELQRSDAGARSANAFREIFS